MKVIKLNAHAHPREREKGLKEAVKHLKRGGLVVYPTETAYGIGADARNGQAVEKIFALKRRTKTKTLPVIVGTMRQARRIAGFSEKALELAQRFWPGPLTLVLPERAGAGLVAGILSEGNVALRISSHPVAAALACGIRGPVVSTSANISGKGECYSARAVTEQFRDISDFDVLILDCGSLRRAKPSTIARVTDGEVEVLRWGAIHRL